MAGKPIPKFEEVFQSTTEEQVNNALVKELFLDYAANWNKQ